MCLKQYYVSNYYFTLILFSSVYIIKQAFCIPGSFILVSYNINKTSIFNSYKIINHFQNIIAGSVFGASIGFLLVCTLSSIGVSACYFISKLCNLEKLLEKYFPSKLTSAKNTLEYLVSKIIKLL